MINASVNRAASRVEYAAILKEYSRVTYPIGFLLSFRSHLVQAQKFTAAHGTLAMLTSGSLGFAEDAMLSQK